MSPPSHLLLAPPLHLHDLSLLLETQSLSRPTERPPPYVKQILHFGLPDLPSPSILKLVSASYPPSLPSLVWPPRKPPEEFRTTLKVVLLRGLRFNRLPPKPPWMLCWSAALSMACLVLLFLYVIYVVLCFLVHVMFLSLVSFKPLPKWSLDRRYHTRFVGLYEDESRFTNFAIYQLIFVQRQSEQI